MIEAACIPQELSRYFANMTDIRLVILYGEDFKPLQDMMRAARIRRFIDGFRNIAVHEYESIDWSIVHSIATRKLDDFREFAGRVVAAIGAGS